MKSGVDGSRTLQRLLLFVSAPSDMGAERVLCDDIVAELNTMIEDTYGVTLRLIDWRRDIIPGIGSDPQQVINSQTGDYQIYLGLFGTRFGTPTPRAGSGAEDEFNLAYGRFRSDPTAVRILLYFRTGLSGNVLDVDPEQLRRVRDFRARAGTENGVFYADFVSAEEFVQLARTHLLKLIATQLDGDRWKPVPGLEPAQTDSVPSLVAPSGDTGLPDEDDESDLLDLRVQMEDAFAEAMRALNELAAAGRRSTEIHTRRRTEAEALIKLGGRNPKQVQAWANSYGADFANYARELRPLVAAFRSASDDFFDKMSRLISLQIRIGASSPADIAKGLASFAQADDSARAARDVYKQISDSIGNLRALTRQFKRQQRDARTQVDDVNAAIASWIDKSRRLRESLANPAESEGNITS